MLSDLKIVFAGTPEIARAVLESLCSNKVNIQLALTQIDRPSGRGQKLNPPPVKEYAEAQGIEVYQPLKVRNNQEVIDKLEALKPDIMIVVAYGMIIPKAILDIPRLGCINIHVSLLPKYRGAAPIQRSIIDGEKLTGVTIMQMDEGLDTGDILLQEEVIIEDNDTSGSLHDKLASVGARLIIDYLNNHETIKGQKQAEIGVTYASKIEKVEALIDWNENSLILSNKIRGFNPSPGAYTYLNGNIVKVWFAKSTNLTSNKPVGTIIDIVSDGIMVSSGNNSVLCITELQDASKKRQNHVQYLQAHQDLLGLKFGI